MVFAKQGRRILRRWCPSYVCCLNIIITSSIYHYIWGFPINGGTPKWMVFKMKNAIQKWMMTGGTPMTQETSIINPILFTSDVSQLGGLRPRTAALALIFFLGSTRQVQLPHLFRILWRKPWLVGDLFRVILWFFLLVLQIRNFREWSISYKVVPHS